MEIERKFLVSTLPESLEKYPRSSIEQGYLNQNPVLRIRRQDQEYIFTYKSKGLMIRQEEEFPLTPEAYEHLKQKIDGNLIQKTRYRIPFYSHVIELDIFEGTLSPLALAEVEFSSEEEADAFVPPAWFGKEVTFSGKYHNSYLSLYGYHPATTE